MAKRGSSKDRSIRQEDFIAKRYGGVRSPSSGGAASDQGDVRTSEELIECKVRGEYDPEKAYPKSISVSMADLAKITDEAWSEGLQPMMALRVISPDHPLADKDGHVDLIVRHIDDDLSRDYN